MRREEPLICKIPREELGKFLKWLEDNHAPVYGLKKEGEKITFGKISGPHDIYLGGVRSLHPYTKTLFLPPRERVARYFGEEDLPTVEEKRIIFGFKACDLRALAIYDIMFDDTVPSDPFYLAKRESYYIISFDCTEVLPTCFCVFVDGNPYPESKFDLNLTPLEDIIIMEVGSQWGEVVVKKYPTWLAEPEDIKRRDLFREEMKKKVMEVNKEFFPLSKPLTYLLRTHFDSPVWEEKSQTCVACGGCTAICPTCYCYTLYDEEGEKTNERTRIWDYCQYPGFAQEAGGANPRKKRMERFRHRYAHKFDYGMVRKGVYECTGCGRCISVCPGKIDMREVLLALDQEELKKGKENVA